jgi:hypothetical protein
MKKIFTEGHRGYCAKYPENTLISYEAALDLGVDAIEFDIWLTKDKVPVLMHDENARRTCGVDVTLRELTLAEVKELEPCYEAKFGERITYTFAESELKRVHIVFDSDLNRKTQDGGVVDRTHNTRILKRLDSPDLHMPATLCRDFKLIGTRGGEEIELLSVSDNRKRAYDLKLSGKFDSLTLVPMSLWGEGEYISVISFDFA